MGQIVDSALTVRRLELFLASGFSIAAVGLACLGVFGVVSYYVSRRTPEIGVRIALGATRRDVVAMLMKQAMRPVVVGIGVGLAGSLALGRILASQLYGVSPYDPVVLGVIAVIVFIAAIVASYWPASRGARIEPVDALHWE